MLHDQDLLSVQEVRRKVDLAYQAWLEYRSFPQERIDAIVEAMGEAGRAHARALAEHAVRETGMGNVEDKVAKNLLNADLLVRSIRGLKTVGVLREIPEKKIIEIGVPVGVVAAVLPTTNPTSTAIYKSVIALKAGNAIVLSPHPRAKDCTCSTAAVLIDAARGAGAPEGIIQCVQSPTLEATNALMKHPKTGVILSTGGSGIVRAAYSSGKPAFGVGPGNVPVLLDSSYNVDEAVAMVVDGKSFDYGTVCSSEQTLVAERALRDRVLAALQSNNAYLLNEEERSRVERVLFKPGTFQVSGEAVGQSPARIAELAGIRVPASTRILVAEIPGVGREHPLSAEKLSPVLAVHFVDSFEAGLQACDTILHFGGLGHTCVIYSRDDARIRAFGLRLPAFRVLVNTSSPQGSTGITTNVQPSMTLGCGAVAGNITSDNVGPQHLINVKRIAYAVRTPAEALTLPSKGDAPMASPITRATVAAAVEKYLAQRGVAVAASPAPASSSAPPAATPLRSVVAGVVDQFLSRRPAPAAPKAPSCGCSLPTAVAPQPSTPAPAAAANPNPAPPAPEITIVDFVCEADVRAAINQKKKIYIGPKTIVTPAARALANRDEILVQARR